MYSGDATSHTKAFEGPFHRWGRKPALLGGDSAGTVDSMTTPLVLLVDDNEGNRDLMELHLEGLPIRCMVASDGQGALESVAHSRPDLILLDVMMPKMSGFEVCRAIKSDESLREIPIVMVTALDSVVDQDRAKSEGADGYLVKPIDRDGLRAEVSSRLNLDT